MLFFAEMWERFCFYGMRSLLMLYMVSEVFKYNDETSANIYGSYNAMIYLTPLIGGIVADKLLGYRWTILIGGLFMAVGQFTLVVQQEFFFYTGMAFMVVGNGMFKPNISTLVGKLYGEGNDATLDGLQHVERFAGAEYRAIDYIRENVGRGSAILEAVGGDYSEHGRISSSTGVPTVLNWPGHELQWRGSAEAFAGREEDVQTIYQTFDVALAVSLLDKYDVDYVYIGQREREKYGEDGLAKFTEFMTPVFTEGDVVVYKR